MNDYTAENLRELVRSMVDVIPANCGCRGNGWILTDFDTVHQCPRHYRDQPNQEYSEDGAFENYDWDAVRLQLEREAYVWIRGEAVDWMVSRGSDAEKARKQFIKSVTAYVANPSNATPNDWLEAAYSVMTDFRHGFLTRP